MVTPAPRRVLLIDDDARLYELLRDYLDSNAIALDHAPDGGRGLLALTEQVYDAVLLDVMMPGLDGLQTLRRLREKSDVPVIMLTAKGDEADRVVGLELGADDYVAKPFGPRELLARLRARFRRAEGASKSERLATGDLVLDRERHEVTFRGNAVEVTGLQFDLLAALMVRKGRVVSREQLLAEAGRDDVTVGPRTVDVHISQLRKRLSEAGAQDRDFIKTVRGVGYVLKNAPPVSREDPES